MCLAIKDKSFIITLVAILACVWIFSLKLSGNVTRQENESGDTMQNKSLNRVLPARGVTDGRSNRQRKQQARHHSSPRMERVMKIHDFNPLRWNRHAEYYHFAECPYNLCEFTDNPIEADVTMVNIMRIKDTPLPPRKPGALLLAYTKEPPTFRRTHYVDFPQFKNSVNWTRCIFADSTFRSHYRNIRERSPPPPSNRNYDALFDHKKLQVAWFVSHCKTQARREDYVARLSKKIQVDIFGKCSNLTCGSHGYSQGSECVGMLSRDYKFYISFENSMCADYVTEKFYNMYDGADVIPIVRGGANYSEFVPKETFIDTKDFSSPEELGDYLVALSKDKRRYTKMLRVKDRYETIWPSERFYCTLCEALHTRREIPSVYSDFYKWLLDHCWEPTDL